MRHPRSNLVQVWKRRFCSRPAARGIVEFGSLAEDGAAQVQEACRTRRGLIREWEPMSWRGRQSWLSGCSRRTEVTCFLGWRFLPSLPLSCISTGHSPGSRLTLKLGHGAPILKEKISLFPSYLSPNFSNCQHLANRVQFFWPPPISPVIKSQTTGTSLVVQRVRLRFQYSGSGFDPWLGS